MAVKNVVLVHGAWADGSSWSKVIPLLQHKGLHAVAVQNPLSSIDDDLASTKRLIDAQDGPVLLAGHSYGGAVITQAGMNDKVAGLVYVAAFAPDEGETLGGLASRTKPSWFVIASHDRAIAPEQEKSTAERMKAKMLTLPTSHVPMLSQPHE